MKKIFNQHINYSPLSLGEARKLADELKRSGVRGVVEHRSVYGYPTAELAERATKNAVLEEHRDYTLLFIGTEYISFEGYKVVFIGLKELPSDFCQKYPNFCVGTTLN